MNENDLNHIPETGFMDVFNHIRENAKSNEGALLGGAINAVPQLAATIAGGTAHGAEYMGLLSEDAPLNAEDITDASFDWADNVAQDLPVVGNWFAESMNENPTTARVGEFVGPFGVIGATNKGIKAAAPAMDWFRVAGQGNVINGIGRYLGGNSRYANRANESLIKGAKVTGTGLSEVAATEALEQGARRM